MFLSPGCLYNAAVKPLYKKGDKTYYDKLQSYVSSKVFVKAMHNGLSQNPAIRLRGGAFKTINQKKCMFEKFTVIW
jgi:hypothetical protein